jgi:hypothetical protein
MRAPGTDVHDESGRCSLGGTPNKVPSPLRDQSLGYTLRYLRVVLIVLKKGATLHSRPWRKLS